MRLVDAILVEYKQHGHPLPQAAAQRVAELEREIDEKVRRCTAERRSVFALEPEQIGY